MASLPAPPPTDEDGNVRSTRAHNSLRRTDEQVGAFNSSNGTTSDPNGSVHRTPGHARQVPHSPFSPASPHDLYSPVPAFLDNPEYYHNLSTPPRTPSPTRTRNSLFPHTFPQALDHSPTRTPFRHSAPNGNSIGTSADAYGCPVSALEGRSTPFFMALPDEEHDQQWEGEQHEGEGYGDCLVPFGLDGVGESTDQAMARRTLGRQDFAAERARNGGGGEDESILEPRDNRRDSGYSEVCSSPPRSATYETNPSFCPEKADAVQLFSTVNSLASRVVDLTNLTGSLYTRLSFLEETSHARDREVDALRSIVHDQQESLSPRHSQGSQPRPFIPPPLPYDLQDYPDESTLENGGDLTPPVSAPPLHHPHPHHCHPIPFTCHGSRSSTPRSLYPTPAPGRSSLPPLPLGPLEGPFAQPYGPSPFSPQHQGFPQWPHPAMPPAFQSSQGIPSRPQLPRLNLSNLATTDGTRRSSMIAEQALRQAVDSRLQGGNVGPRLSNEGGMGRERSMSFSGAGSGTSSTSSSSAGLRSTAMHARTLSLPTALTSRNGRGSGPHGVVEQLNYRLLLENDSDIDSETFVRRILVQNDQQCSLFLQQRVRTTTDDRRKHLFTAVSKNVLELSQSKFGNFLVSRCLEAGDLKLAKAFETSFTGNFLSLSLDPFGCHVVQKLLDCGDSSTKGRVVEELLPCPSTLMQKNAGHVWNRILTTSNPPTFYRRIAEMGQGTWAEVVKDDGGSLIVQHIMEDWTEAHTSVVAREILEKVGDVAKSACGSFVLAHLIDRNALPFCSKIMQLAPALIADNFGAKIVDRCLRSGRVPTTTVTSLVDAFTGSSHPALLVCAASHTNGMQLLHALLMGPPTSISHRDKEKLARFILLHAAVLAKDAGPGGARLVSVCEQRGIKP